MSDNSYFGNRPSSVALAFSAAQGFALFNGYIEWSVAGNALTAAVKTLSGNDPSATDPVYIVFRSATAGGAAPVERTLTAATSITLDDTSTMGTANSTAFRLWCVAFDDGGTVRLGLINCLSGTSIYPLAGFGIASSTQETTAADSAHVFYTDGAAVTSKAYSVLGYATWETGLATAGTWSSAPTREQMWGMGIPLPGQTVQTQRTASSTAAQGTTTIPLDNTIPQSGEGDQYMSQAITPTSAANVLRVDSQLNITNNFASGSITAALFQDATANALAAAAVYVSTATAMIALRVRHVMLSALTAATTFKIRAGGNSAGTTIFNGNGAGPLQLFAGVSNSFIEVQELMA